MQPALRRSYFGVQLGALNPFKMTGSFSAGGTATVTGDTGWLVPTGQWYLDGVAVTNATSASYQFQVADQGKVPTFKPTGTPLTVTGTRVAAPAPAISLAPVLAALAAGAKAQWTAGTFSNGTASYKLVDANGAILGTATNTYTAPTQGVQLTVILTVTAADGRTVSQMSNTVTVGAATQAITLPTDFTPLWAPSFNVIRSAYGQYDLDITADSLKPGSTGTTVTYYVDPVNGNNGNSGATTSLARQSVSSAFLSTTYDTVFIKLMSDANRMVWGGLNTQRPYRNAVIQSWDGNRIYVSKGIKPVWTQDTTYTNIYKSPALNTNNQGIVVDVRPAVLGGEEYPKDLTPVGSASAVAATAGTYWHDYTNSLVYVRAHDDRNLVGDGFMTAPNHGTGGNSVLSVEDAMAGPRTFWIENMTLIGGIPLTAVNGATNFAATYRPQVVLKNCALAASFQSANGDLTIRGAYDVYLFDCAALYGYKDGFNYHIDTTSTGGGAPRVVEVRPRCVRRNGYAGLNQLPVTLNTNNHSTLHETCMAITVMPVFGGSDPLQGSEGRPLHDIESSRRLVFGGILGVSQSSQVAVTGADYPNVQAGNTATEVTIMDLYEPTIPKGDNTQVYAHQNASIRIHGMPAETFSALVKGGAGVANITNVAM